MPLTKRLFTAGLLLILCAASAGAELRYTMKIESQKSTQPSTAPANPLMTMLGGIVASTLAPVGGLEITVTIGDRGSRVEYNQAYIVVPAGGVTLVKPDGSIVVFDPATKTYWKMAKPDLSMVKADVAVARTGERATVTGVATERAKLDITVPLPVPAGTQLPPGIPASLAVSGEAWIADQYKEYARMSAGMAGLMSLGLEKLSSEGLPMKSVLRGEMFGDQEIASTITSISEVSVPASTYEVPAGYTEVAPPTTIPGIARP